jgi:hypothetical protein
VGTPKGRALSPAFDVYFFRLCLLALMRLRYLCFDIFLRLFLTSEPTKTFRHMGEHLNGGGFPDLGQTDGHMWSSTPARGRGTRSRSSASTSNPPYLILRPDLVPMKRRSCLSMGRPRCAGCA